MISPALVSILLVLLVSALMIVTGLRRQPGIGVLGAVVIIALSLELRGRSLVTLGFAPPENWGVTILLGLALGALIQLVSVAVIEPVTEELTGTRHNHSVVAGAKGNWKAFVQLMVMVWLLVVFLEEGIFRGFLMNEVRGLVGDGALGVAFNIVFTSVVFGLAHSYQGRAGLFSTGIVGAVLAGIFVWSGYNLWLVIFTHGFIDTIGIALIAVGWDRRIQRWLWRAGAV